MGIPFPLPIRVFIPQDTLIYTATISPLTGDGYVKKCKHNQRYHISTLGKIM